MNPTTPEQARQLAKQLSEIVYREDEHHTLLWNCCEQSAGYLRSLSDQVEALTAELESWRFTNRIDELQRAHDAYKADAARYKELMRIAYSDSPQKHLIEVTMDQSKLDAAIAKGTA